MPYFDDKKNAFVPEQKAGAKIIKLNDKGEQVEVDNPNYLPFVYYPQSEVDDFFALEAKGYKRVAENGRVKMIPPTPLTEEELRKKYESKVDSLIREKYTLSQEFAILRQAASKPEEYSAYNEYCELCKATAKAEVYGG